MLIPDFDFRASARPGPPTNALSSKFSFRWRGTPELFLNFPLLRFRPPQDVASGKSLVQTPVFGLSQLTYYYSVRQQERSYSRQLNFWSPKIKVLATSALHAYLPLLPAVKSSHPHVRTHFLLQVKELTAVSRYKSIIYF